MPPLIEALRRPGLSREEHDLLVRNMGRLQPSAVPPLAAALESSDPVIGGRRRHGAGGDRRYRGRAVPDVPGGRAVGEPGGAIGRAGGDRPADRPAVRAAAEAPGPRAGRRRMGVPPRAFRGSRRAGRPLVVGRRPQGAGPARGDAGRGRARPSACTSPGRRCGWTRTTDRPRSRSSAWPWSGPPSGSAPRRCRRRSRPPSPRRPPPGPRCWPGCSRRPSPTASRSWPPPRSSRWRR